MRIVALKVGLMKT